jgi:hypothetical protein
MLLNMVLSAIMWFWISPSLMVLFATTMFTIAGLLFWCEQPVSSTMAWPSLSSAEDPQI